MLELSIRGFRKCNILSLVILTCNLSKIIFICKAFNYEAHSGYTRINCWAHCSRLIDNELANVRTPDNPKRTTEKKMRQKKTYIVENTIYLDSNFHKL